MVLLNVEARPAGGGPSVRECFDDALVAAVGAACAVDAFRARAEAERAELIELARRTAMTLPEALVDPGVPAHVEREEAAMRALIAEIATGMRVSESLAAVLVEESRMLVNELPQTLTALGEAAIAPEHARVIIRAALDLPIEVRGRFDEAATPLARECTPPQLRRRLPSLRERLHPESLTDRHVRCAVRRGVWLDGDLDGMATLHLHLHLPAPDAHGAFDCIDRAARSLHEAPEEERTLGQLRADVVTALLLDGEIVPGPDGSPPATAVPRGMRPRVSVTVPVLTLLGRSDEPGVLDGYGPIDPATARRLAADAPSFTRILTHPETGAVLSVGRTAYRVPADLRRPSPTATPPAGSPAAPAPPATATSTTASSGSTTDRPPPTTSPTSAATTTGSATPPPGRSTTDQAESSTGPAPPDDTTPQCRSHRRSPSRAQIPGDCRSTTIHLRSEEGCESPSPQERTGHRVVVRNDPPLRRLEVRRAEPSPAGDHSVVSAEAVTSEGGRPRTSRARPQRFERPRARSRANR
ncbi:DUF222 domain-containing protein [Rathayibacter rubneri]|uniref:DUF222 domain-containing protein n=1 Tax=Rathayibacter rubneri TaxID=2950106 RepID=UPI00355866B4